MPERSHDANRRLESRFESVERIVRRAHERINHLVIFEDAHNRAEADRAHKIDLGIFRREQIVELAVGCDRRQPDVSVLAVARQPDHRLGFEGNLQPVGAEKFLDDRPHDDLIIGGLDGAVETPIDLELLANVRHMPALIDLRLEPADFLMPHLDVEAVLVEFDDALLERGSDGAVSPLPILFLHDLRSAHLFDGCLVERRLDPKLELRRRGEDDVDNIAPVDVEPRNFGMRMKQLEQLRLDVGQRIGQNRAAVDALAVVN